MCIFSRRQVSVQGLTVAQSIKFQASGAARSTMGFGSFLELVGGELCFGG
jgi:hypothetical protein